MATVELQKTVKPEDWTSDGEKERHKARLSRAIALSSQAMLYIATAPEPSNWREVLQQMKVADRFISLYMQRAHKVEMVATTNDRVREHRNHLALIKGL